MSQPTRAAMFNLVTGAPIFPTDHHYTMAAANDAGVIGLDPDISGQLAVAEDTGKLFRSDGNTGGDWVSVFAFNQVTCVQFLITGGFRPAVVSKTATYTATVFDHTIKTDATGGAFDIDLPDATTCAGLILVIIKMDASGNSVTVDPHSTQHMSGQSSITLDVNWDCLTIQSDGANWLILSFIDQV